ncbi:hypothetical protein [Halomicrobium urmianum]|uniref:hypothetical protein n=1 Tax=Halomicrobium urmianum TaxID=1586233 RepID=UPI001CD9AC22|nr:hypothetical protein [Halomicrobium urmianum]
MAEDLPASGPNLGSRILVTWVELTVVGLIGGVVGTSLGGPPALVVYFATTLLSVAVLFHNVNELIREWIRG